MYSNKYLILIDHVYQYALIIFYRVLAKNAAGAVSDYSLESFPVKCCDEVTPPRIEFDASLRDTLVVKAGDTVKLEAYISGGVYIQILSRVGKR